MIKSMTGFGSSEYSDEKRSVTAEVRSVNHRYCDVSVKMPRRYSFAEEALKKAVKEILSRGKIDVSISVVNLTEDDVKRFKRLFCSNILYHVKKLGKFFRTE